MCQSPIPLRPLKTHTHPVPYNPEIHHRQSIRWRGFDYANPGFYFVTVCTHERELTLAIPEVVAAIDRAWLDLPNRFPAVELDEFIIMPNHIHGVLVLHERGPKFGVVMRAFKSISAIAANRILGRSERPFWQRNYYERVIRSERELNAVREYIRNNPLGWDSDPDNPAILISSEPPTA
jgi:REP element-mobilizing transposase RayT